MKKPLIVLFIAVIIFGFLPHALLGHPRTCYAGKPMAGKATWYIDSVRADGGKFVDGDFAAMRDVPLGATARVTDIATGRSIIVSINDRGPSEAMSRKGRIIDLTKSAFVKLAGNHEIGEINVLVELINTRV